MSLPPPAVPPAPPAPLALAAILRRAARPAAFDKDARIFDQDAAADSLHLVTAGVVRTVRLLPDGRRQVGGFYYPGETIGFETAATHAFSAEALGPCEVASVRRASLDALADPVVLGHALAEAMQRELARTQAHLLVLGRKSACEKVATFLKTLAQPGRGSPVPLPMGRQDIADHLGLTIETVSRMLTHLQGAEVVRFETCRNFQVTRWDALERLAA
jgi:CRP/FNR family nitrogen fixation transcriptional regulator